MALIRLSEKVNNSSNQYSVAQDKNGKMPTTTMTIVEKNIFLKKLYTYLTELIKLYIEAKIPKKRPPN